jgi:hypothetical protein
MGTGASFSYWSEAEQAENERAERRMNGAKDFILDYMYYGIQVRSGKKSWDPSSPLCFEVDPRVLEEAMLGIGEVQKTLLEGVPSTVIVNKKGIIKIAFMMDTLIEHELHVKDIDDAIALDNDSIKFGPFYVPMPEPPTLVKAEKTRMHVGWDLPQPAGISQKCEVQYCHVHPKMLPRVQEYLCKLEVMKKEVGDVASTRDRDKDRDVYRTMDSEDDPYGLGECPLAFACLSVRSYNKPNFLTFSFMDKELKPGDMLVFRVRYMNHRGWSSFSYPSEILRTLPDIPSTPTQPISSFVAARSAQLFWVPPHRDNGAAITEYKLKGKSTGGDYVTLYQGPNTSFLANDLHPEFAYSFEVAAVNSVGPSAYSKPMTITTPKDSEKPRARDPESFEWIMAMQFRDAWREMWDPRSERVFWFNIITGIRVLEMPDALKNDISSYAEGEDGVEEGTDGARIESVAEAEHRLEIEFRKKRYHLIRAVHTHASKMVNCPGSTKDSKKVKLSRKSILADGFRKIAKCPPQDMKRRIKFEFEGEDAIDSGGVGKEAFLLLSRACVRYCGTAHRGFLQVTDKASGGVFFVNKDEGMNNANTGDADSKADEGVHPAKRIDDKTRAELATVAAPVLCRFLGRLLGKALYDRQLVDVPLSPLLLKHILGLMRDEEQQEQTETKESSTNMSPTKHPASPTPTAATTASKGSPARSPVGKDNKTTIIGAKYLADGKSGADVESKDNEKKEKEEDEEAFKPRPTSELLLELRDLDQELHKSLCWMLDNDITDIVYERFCVMSKVPKKTPSPAIGNKKGGQGREGIPSFDGAVSGTGTAVEPVQYVYKEIPLCPNGENIDVTNENKDAYVRLLVRWKTHYAVSAMLDPFLQGFYEVIPMRLLKQCELGTGELAMMMNGKPRVDVDDLRAYCIYQGSSGKKIKMNPFQGQRRDSGDEDAGRGSGEEMEEKNDDQDGSDNDEGGEVDKSDDFGDTHETVVWFWQTLRDISQEESRSILSFFTGSSRVPVDGYEPPLNITEGVDMDKDALPKAHTCFNQIVLPRYSTAAMMRKQLLFAAEETQGFQFG